MKSLHTFRGITILLFHFCLLPFALSQNPPDAPDPQMLEELGNEKLRVLSSPKGNYIELITETLPAVKVGETYLIERAELTADSRIDKMKFKQVGEVTPPSNGAEITRYLDLTQAEEYARALDLATVDELAAWMRDHRTIDKYSVFYELSEVRQATGHLWLDESASARNAYIYRVRLGRRGPVLGSGIGRAGVGNIALLRSRPRAVQPKVLDSATLFKWTLTAADSVLLERPAEPSLFDASTAAWEVDDLSGSASLRGRVFVQENGRMSAVGLVLGTRGTRGDTLVFTHRYQAEPGAELYAYLVLEDFVYNAGVPSDTVYAVQRTNSNSELVYWVDSRDTTDGVAITWSPLLERPELAGVTIVRVGAEDVRDTLGTFSAQDQPLIDRDLEVGIHYVYEASASYLPGTGLSQEVPATTVGTYLAFEWPLPPHHLRVEPAGENVLLNWNEAPNASRFGYRIFRGTRPDSLRFASGPIMETSFVDTAAYLDGRSMYYYAVQSVNLRQDTSVFSEVVSIRPQREVFVRTPQSVDYYFANESLVVSWDDVRKRDNTITGFRLERSDAPGAPYEAIGPEVFAKAEYRDTAVLDFSAGVSYRVASINVLGAQSPFSQDRLVVLDAPELTYNTGIQNIFYLQALDGGVAVSWPVGERADRVAYKVYRRAVSESRDFKALSQVPIEQGYYLDADASTPGLYEYALQVIGVDGEGGQLGNKRTVRKR